MNDTADISALLDMTLEDIPDLPSFEPFPNGAYIAILSSSSKQVNGKPSVELKFTIKEVAEMVDLAATPPNVGDASNCLYALNNETGLGMFKRDVSAVWKALGCTSLASFLEATKNIEVMVVTKRRSYKDSNGEDRTSMQITSLQLV